ncbi:hypothetical protein [Schlesneria paludicola]|uniref:hypothetical protein n=1 Tax=Schlesneria paludicola TaxID=360056 RepID=UPI00029A6CEC|nr:hypothetical protein [Schlesneria paludicola]
MSILGKLCAGLVVTILAGCSSGLSDSERLNKIMHGDVKVVTPVSGNVLVNGTPEEKIAILLHSADGSQRIGSPRPVVTGKGGHFEFTTYSAGDGLPAGEYKLTFLGKVYRKSTGSFVGTDLLKDRYSDPRKSRFTLKVVEGEPQKELKFELTTK